MSTLRRLVLTADPALLRTDAPPAGVPDDAERLTDDGLLGWRFAADEWAAAPEPGSGWDVLTVPATVAAAPAPLVVTDVDSTLIRQEVIELLAAHAGREAEVAAAGGRHLHVYADLYVTFGGVVDERSDAEVFSGTPAELAAKICHWHQRGVAGVRLRPAVNATDLPVIADEVVPALQRVSAFRTRYRAGETLCQRLGLERIS